MTNGHHTDPDPDGNTPEGTRPEYGTSDRALSPYEDGYEYGTSEHAEPYRYDATWATAPFDRQARGGARAEATATWPEPKPEARLDTDEMTPLPVGPAGVPAAPDASASAAALAPSVPAPDPVPSADGPPAPKKPGRDRYLDLLRTLALVRVVAYHMFGWAWLTVLFPSMGVMFALAGSLMARSLKRPALGVIRGRIRRLLPPLWAFSALALTLLFLDGWNPAEDPDRGSTWGLIEVFNYIVPFGAPPYPWTIGDGSGFLETTWADQAIGPLWYLRAYLWFVIASPLLLWAFRRAPWPTLLAPLGLTAVVGTGLVTIPGETGNAVTDFAVYGSCWILGFAHHEGMLQKIPRYVAVSLAVFVMAFGLWWASGHLTSEGWDLNDIPLAQAAWSFGFVVILLQYSPSWQELPGRLKRWDRLVTLFNSRAMTIYLWHNMLIMATFPLVDKLYELPFMDDKLYSLLDSTYEVWAFVLVWPLLALAILSLGWVEDLAAKRSPRLWPDGRKKPNRSGPRSSSGSDSGPKPSSRTRSRAKAKARAR